MPTVYTRKKLPKRHKLDYYQTPYQLALASLAASVRREPFDPNRIRPNGGGLKILDVGAGSGVWGEAARALWPEAYIVGAEKNKKMRKPKAYDLWLDGDFLASEHAPGADYALRVFGCDFVIGNPPFIHGEAMVREGNRWLKATDESRLLFLLPQHFLGSETRGLGLFDRASGWPPAYVTQLIQRPNFEGAGNNNPNLYMLLEWRVKPARQTVLDWLDWKNYRIGE